MSMSAGGRSVKVEADVSNSSSNINNDRAEIVLDNQKLVIEFASDQITLDGKEYAQLPSGTKEIDIQFNSGKLTILADGSEVTPSVEAEKSE